MRRRRIAGAVLALLFGLAVATFAAVVESVPGMLVTTVGLAFAIDSLRLALRMNDYGRTPEEQALLEIKLEQIRQTGLAMNRDLAFCNQPLRKQEELPSMTEKQFKEWCESLAARFDPIPDEYEEVFPDGWRMGVSFKPYVDQETRRRKVEDLRQKWPGKP